MSTLKISKHSDVPAALDLVREEVDKEAKRIFSAGGDALKEGKIKPAKEAIAYAEKLSDFVKKIQKLGDEWLKLEARIDAAAPEVKEIVQLTKSQKAHKTGFTRNVASVAPKSNFTVKFPDGEVIADKKAYWVLAHKLWVEKSIPKPYREPIAAGRLLVVSPVAQTATRVDARTAAIRNRYILEHSERVVFAAIDPNGALSRLIGECPDLQCQVLA